MSTTDKNINQRVSVRVLNSRDDSLKSKVATLLCNADNYHMSTNGNEVKNAIKCLKSTFTEYRENNLEIVKFHVTNGSVSNVPIYDLERREMFSEYKSAYIKLNQRLIELEQTPASSVVNPSERASSVATVNEWFDSNNIIKHM